MLVNQSLIAAVATQQNARSKPALNVVARDPDGDRSFSRAADREIAHADGGERKVVNWKPSLTVSQPPGGHGATPYARDRKQG
jgi:hypothetical protein